MAGCKLESRSAETQLFVPVSEALGGTGGLTITAGTEPLVAKTELAPAIDPGADALGGSGGWALGSNSDPAGSEHAESDKAAVMSHPIRHWALGGSALTTAGWGESEYFCAFEARRLSLGGGMGF